jgi:hypothetical protein
MMKNDAGKGYFIVRCAGGAAVKVLLGICLLILPACSKTVRDMDTYRGHAAQASREPGKNLEKCGNSFQATGEGLYNVVTACYGTDKFAAQRENDFKNPLSYTKEAGQNLGQTGKDVAFTFYSLFDLVVIDALPDPERDYDESHALVRPLKYTGRSVRDLYNSAVSILNIPTVGLADNFEKAGYSTFKEFVETLKFGIEAGANTIVRKPVHLVTGKKRSADSSHAAGEKAIDWIVLVPWEYASNVIEGEGFRNMEDFKGAVETKGYTFNTLEFGGNIFLLINSFR